MSAALAKIHIARKDLGLTEDDYRATLRRLTGRESARDLSDAQIGVVLAEFKRQGWAPKIRGKAASLVIADELAVVSRPGKSTDSRTARKAKAMWISLYQLGVVQDGSDKALNAFGKRQLGVEVLVWASGQQMYRLIEALKAMAHRAGWYQNGSALALKRSLVACQCRTLKIAQPAGLDKLTDGQLNDLAQQLGRQIRAEA